MPENSTPISKWSVTNEGFPAQICDSICTKAQIGHIDNLPDKLVLRENLHGIELTFERIATKIQGGDGLSMVLSHVSFALYTNAWVIEMLFDPATAPLDASAIKKQIWNGRGDHEQWLRDGALLRLFQD